MAHLLDVLGRMVVAESGGIDDADRVRSQKGGEEKWLRQQLNSKAMPELRGRVAEVRDWLRQGYGAAKTKKLLEFTGRTPRGVEKLVDLAAIMVRRLRLLKPISVAGVDVEPAKWSDYLEPSLERARELLTRIEQCSERVHSAVSVKQRALAAFDKTYRRVLRRWLKSGGGCSAGNDQLPASWHVAVAVGRAGRRW